MTEKTLKNEDDINMNDRLKEELEWLLSELTKAKSGAKDEKGKERLNILREGVEEIAAILPLPVTKAN